MPSSFDLAEAPVLAVLNETAGIGFVVVMPKPLSFCAALIRQ
jgi:hypothetical protein